MALQTLRAALAKWTPGARVTNDPFYAMAAAWPDIVGDAVAANSAPLALAGTTLIVATRSSAWSQQLQFLSPVILEALRALDGGASLERISFRAGALRSVRKASAPAGRRRANGGPSSLAGAALGPAENLEEAFERVRNRIGKLRQAARRGCADCEAPLDGPGGGRCAPCTGRAEQARALSLERLVYMAPWFSPAELREQIPGLTEAEFERARRHLLHRWWQVLERTKRAGRLSRSRYERDVASSYVLLQSRLRPDRITPAVVRNLLGPDLEALLWPAAHPEGEPARRGGGLSSSNETV